MKRMIALVALGTFLTCAMLADSKMVILLIGPPGAGKTTQARKLSKKYNLPSVSMADLLKKNAGWAKWEARKYSKRKWKAVSLRTTHLSVVQTFSSAANFLILPTHMTKNL